MPHVPSPCTPGKWTSACWEPGSTSPPTGATGLRRWCSARDRCAPAGAPERGIRIVPDQRASLDTAGTFRIREVRAEDYISWIHGYYRFDNTPLSDVLARLARYYNRTFDCSPEVGVMTISGKLELNDDPGEVLRILSLTAPIRFRVSENGFRLYSVQTLRKEHDDNPNRMPMENRNPN